MAAAPVCAPCTLAGGSYRTAAPLELLVVFHDYGASDEAVLANGRLREIAAAHGRLLVAPDGVENARGRWRQADIFAGSVRFERANGCRATPQELASRGALHCRTWTRCETGRLTLCLHAGGHFFDLEVLDAALGGG